MVILLFKRYAIIVRVNMLDTGDQTKKDVDILNKTAKNRDILENAESKDLKHCFEIGREPAKAVTNPFVLMIWSLRDRIAKRGGKKHV